MTKTWMTMATIAMLGSTSLARAQWDADPAYTDSRGFLGGMLGVGIGINGQLETRTEWYADTTLIFAVRGGVLLGEEHRGTITLEVAPTTNRLDWTQRATATGFVSGGKLVQIRNSREWAWHVQVGVGVGGGYSYRFLTAARLDILTFNYRLYDKVWVDFGLPTVRFHMEVASDAKYNVQFVFPLGITWTI